MPLNCINFKSLSCTEANKFLVVIQNYTIFVENNQNLLIFTIGLTISIKRYEKTVKNAL